MRFGPSTQVILELKFKRISHHPCPQVSVPRIGSFRLWAMVPQQGTASFSHPGFASQSLSCVSDVHCHSLLSIQLDGQKTTCELRRRGVIVCRLCVVEGGRFVASNRLLPPFSTYRDISRAYIRLQNAIAGYWPNARNPVCQKSRLAVARYISLPRILSRNIQHSCAPNSHSRRSVGAILASPRIAYKGNPMPYLPHRHVDFRRRLV